MWVDWPGACTGRERMAEVRRDWLPFHLRIGAVLRGTELQEFTANARRLHTSFHELNKEYPELFPGMTFTTPLSYPYSQELASAIFRLQQGDAISADNPKWVRYRIQEGELDAKLADVRESGPEVMTKLLELGKRIGPSLELTDEERDAGPAMRDESRAVARP